MRLDDLLVDPEAPHHGSTIRQENVPKEAPIPAGREYLGIKELAAYAGISVRKLRTLKDDPLHPLPYYRIGGRLYFRRGEFDSWSAKYRRLGSQDLNRLMTELFPIRRKKI